MTTYTTTDGEQLHIVRGALGIPTIRATKATAEPVHELRDGHHPVNCPACKGRPIALPAGPNGGNPA